MLLIIKNKKGGYIIKKKIKIICVFTTILFVFFLVISFIQKYKQENQIYFEINNKKITYTEYNYYFEKSYGSFLSQYESYLEYINLDLSLSLSEQYTNDGETTWEEYFKEKSINEIKYTIVLNELADKDKTFKYDYKNDYDSFVKSIEKYAIENSYTIKNTYKQIYGENATQAMIKKINYKYARGLAYYEHLEKNYNPTEEEIQQYYQANKKEYDRVTFRSFTFSANTSEENTTQENNELMEVAKEKANLFFNQISNEETFKNLCILYSEEENISKEDNSLYINYSYEEIYESSIPAANWIFDEARKKDSCAIIEDQVNGNYHIIYFIERDRSEDYTCSIREIFIPAIITDLKNYNIENEDLQDSYEAAEKLVKEYQSSNQTFDEFSSQQTMYKINYYDNVYNGYLEIPLNQWLYDSERKESEIGIVQTDYGSHVIYIESKNNPLWYMNIKTKLTSEFLDSFISKILKEYQVSY